MERVEQQVKTVLHRANVYAYLVRQTAYKVHVRAIDSDPAGTTQEQRK
ncbi:hypothetical protein SAMN05216275_112183 [Streptosporangium canum]|uniref:Uncharacterized protein n=1 Tax=Streptosporangium canum TaxID=324952 RepID=A0A1I3UEW8_9ACTN|nr:hypothetical protein SAMN05216275_112183 [Streptosporangium canum]